MTENNKLGDLWSKVVIGVGVLGTLVQLLGLISQTQILISNRVTVFTFVIIIFVVVLIGCGIILFRKLNLGSSSQPMYPKGWRIIAGATLGANVIVTTLILFLLAYRPCPWPNEKFTDNKFGIIVVDFTEGVAKNYNSKTIEVADRTFRALQARLNVSSLSNKAKIQRVCKVVKNIDDAIKVGKDYNATLVIWGNLAEYSEQSSFQPFFTLMKASNLPSEINPLMFDVELNRVDITDIPTKISARATTIAAYVVGLIYLDETTGVVNYNLALQEFTFAIEQAQKELEESNLSEEQRLGINRTLAMLHVVRGRVYAALGNNDQALDEYDIAEKHDSNYAQIYIARGNHYYALGDFDTAKEHYLKALTIAEHSTAYYGLGCVEFYLGNYSASIDALKSAIAIILEKNGDPSSVRYILAVVLKSSRDYQQTSEQLTKILLSDKASDDLKLKATELLNSLFINTPTALTLTTQTIVPTPTLKISTQIVASLTNHSNTTPFPTRVTNGTLFPTTAYTPTQFPTATYFPTSTVGAPTQFPTPFPNMSECEDGIDNDGDGLIDMNDPECSRSSDNHEDK